MPLELRPNCEFCNRDLPAHSTNAWICTYECTFCGQCVEVELGNVCPNCGGGFQRRPVRPKTEWSEGLSLAKRPASLHRIGLTKSASEIKELRDKLRHIAPHLR
jgi:uncharacterized protein